MSDLNGPPHALQPELRLYSFIVEYRFKSAASWVPASVAFVPPLRICLLVRRPPYISVLVSLSGRSVAPSSAIPANTPRDREYVRISACILASVLAEALRPTGPAATDASAPKVNLLDKSF